MWFSFIYEKNKKMIGKIEFERHIFFISLILLLYIQSTDDFSLRKILSFELS